METKSGLDRQQFWRLALDKKSFNSYISERYGNLNVESPEWGNRMYVCSLFKYEYKLIRFWHIFSGLTISKVLLFLCVQCSIDSIKSKRLSVK